MTEPSAHNTKIVDQFTRWAERFSDEPIHAEADGMRRLLAAVSPEKSLRILDVACGPGIVSCALAHHAGSVTGVDLTPAMIEQAKLRQAREGLTNISWQVADATQLPFADGAFDIVVTRYSFHHLTDPGRALAEMRRVCVPGGRVVVVDATPSPETQAAYDAMERVRDPSHASALSVEQLRALAAKTGGLAEIVYDFHWLDAALERLADDERMRELTALFDADIASGTDRIGVRARHADGGIRFSFPISIFAWRRS